MFLGGSSTQMGSQSLSCPYDSKDGKSLHSLDLRCKTSIAKKASLGKEPGRTQMKLNLAVIATADSEGAKARCLLPTQIGLLQSAQSYFH